MLTKKNRLVILIAAAVVIAAFCVYYFIFRGNPDLEKVTKSLNAHNWDMATAKLKEMIYEDENNNDYKGLLLYAQTRKYLEDNNITTFEKVMNTCFQNLVTIKELIYQNKLNDLGYLNQKEKEKFKSNSKELRKQLAKNGIPTENMKDVESILSQACKIGSSAIKLSQGDEVDQALYGFLLAGNSFWGDVESGEKLMKLGKLNENAQPLFILAGSKFTGVLEKELKNDQSLLNQYTKAILIRSLLKNEVSQIFTNNPKTVSCISALEEDSSEIAKYLYVTFDNAKVFYDENIFPEYLKILEQNNKAGIDVGIYLYKENNIVALYSYLPAQKKYCSRFYNLYGGQLLPIQFSQNGNNKSDFWRSESPVRLLDYNEKNSEITLGADKVEKKTASKLEERYNPKKFYNPYYGFTGGYEYVPVNYTYNELETNRIIYSLNRNKADYVSESNSGIK